MLEFIMVDGPRFSPHRCVACAGTSGPVADTHVEPPGYGRVYVCESCARRLARLFGYAPGDRMDELAGAAKLVEQYQRDLDRTNVELELQRRARASLEQDVLDEKAHVDQLEGRVAQLESRIVQTAESNLALVVGKEGT